MAHHQNSNPAASHRDVYDEVTRYVVAALEQGTIIWKKPWHSVGLPRNITGTACYRGWNAFFLNFVCLYRQYRYPYYITYRQAQQLGGKVKKGEHGYQIIYWAEVRSKYHTITVTDEATGQEQEVHPMIRVPKIHTVFNIDQTEGIKYDLQLPEERTEVAKLEVCEEVIAGMPQRPPISHTGNAAYYVPSLDEVYMPAQGAFVTEAHYYATLFHELAHSTGHSSRLNRQELMESTGFGSASYSREELTAELAAAYLCGVTGIQQETVDNSAAYIQGWLSRLKNDKKFFLKAATQAQAAADFILDAAPYTSMKPQPEQALQSID